MVGASAPAVARRAAQRKTAWPGGAERAPQNVQTLGRVRTSPLLRLCDVSLNVLSWCVTHLRLISVVELDNFAGRSLLFHYLAPHALAEWLESEWDRIIGRPGRFSIPAGLLVWRRLGTSIEPGSNMASAERAYHHSGAR